MPNLSPRATGIYLTENGKAPPPFSSSPFTSPTSPPPPPPPPLACKTGDWLVRRQAITGSFIENFDTFQGTVTQMMLNINEPIARLLDVTITVDQDLLYGYTGPITGMTDIPNPLDYKVEHWVVADIGYYIGVVDLGVDGSFSFESTFPGGKQLRFLRKSDDAWVDTFEKSLVTRSYRLPLDTEPALYTALVDRCFLYDQAVAVCALAAQGHPLVHEYASGLAACVQGGGQIPFSVNRLSGLAPDPYYRTGASAWVMYALAFYLLKFPAGSAATACQTKLNLALTWLETFYVADTEDNRYNLYRGGQGQYAPGYVGFDPDFQIPWVALEHMVDIWFLFDLCATLGIAGYAAKRDSVGATMLSVFWVEEQGRLTQGINAEGYDYASALDQSSWGGIWLLAIGEDAKAARSYEWMDQFAFSIENAVGYSPYNPGLGYPFTVQGVWSEGTAGVALFERALDDEVCAVQTIAATVNLKDERYGYLYVSDLDIANELQPWSSVAGTGWMLLANNPNGFWTVNKTEFTVGQVTV